MQWNTNEAKALKRDSTAWTKKQKNTIAFTNMLVEAQKKERTKSMDSKHGSDGNSGIFLVCDENKRKAVNLINHVKKGHGKMGNIN